MRERVRTDWAPPISVAIDHLVYFSGPLYAAERKGLEAPLPFALFERSEFANVARFQSLE